MTGKRAWAATAKRLYSAGLPPGVMTQDARSELPGQYDPHAVERKWQDSWEREKLYAFEEGSSREVFSIDTPPPTVSGKMHMGHAFSYSQQDFIARYQRMLGKNVFYPWGFDDNGLATERFVEKKCKVRATQMSRKEFQQLCLTSTKEAEAELAVPRHLPGLRADLPHGGLLVHRDLAAELPGALRPGAGVPEGGSDHLVP